MTSNRALTIHFTDGTKLSFDFPAQVEDQHNIAHRIQELLRQPQLVIEADGALLVFPMQNIKYVQAYPSPDKLPDTVIRHATITDAG
ncbi:MAG: hypothetical protein AMJ69_09390 [Gammaproteobacteria bacterium SG8_47]|nr:MAG: hypothetical protein AMJ69_09390 [Gammaproteobacteria bacterium SG8_47]